MSNREVRFLVNRCAEEAGGRGGGGSEAMAKGREMKEIVDNDRRREGQ